MTRVRKGTVAITANSLWYIANFREGLVKTLIEQGRQPIVLAPPDAALDHRFRDVRQLAIAVDRSGLNPITDINLLRAYYDRLRQVRPDVLLSFTVKPNIYGALAARFRNVPAIPTISGLGTAFIRGGLLKQLVIRLYTLALKRCPIVFFENPNDRDLFVAEGIVAACQCRLVPGCGVGLDRFAFADVPDGPVTFLLVARLLGDKGVREYVEAARMLRRNDPSLRFQILGGFDPGNRTQIDHAEVAAWVDEGVIEYLGETDDVRPFLRAASAVVLPSYREGLPRSLLEAAAIGRPLVATDVPGCRELVVDGENGFLCEARSAESLADALNKIARMPLALLSEMGLKGRAMVEQRFDETIVVREYLRAIDELCEPGKA